MVVTFIQERVSGEFFREDNMINNQHQPRIVVRAHVTLPQFAGATTSEGD